MMWSSRRISQANEVLLFLQTQRFTPDNVSITALGRNPTNSMHFLYDVFFQQPTESKNTPARFSWLYRRVSGHEQVVALLEEKHLKKKDVIITSLDRDPAHTKQFLYDIFWVEGMTN